MSKVITSIVDISDDGLKLELEVVILYGKELLRIGSDIPLALISTL